VSKLISLIFAAGLAFEPSLAAAQADTAPAEVAAPVTTSAPVASEAAQTEAADPAEVEAQTSSDTAAEPTPDTTAANPAETSAPTSDQAAAAPVDPNAPIVAYVSREAYVPLNIMTVGNVTFGMVGALAGMSEGRTIAVNNELHDPANAVAVDIAKAFAEQKHAAVSPTSIPLAGNAKVPAEAVAADPKAAYIVDVQTYAATAMYFSLDWTHYALMYGARLQIIDAATQKVVVKGRCFINPKKTPESPGYSKMLEDRAAVLKQMLVQSGQACVEQLKTKALKLG
jgi:hypothetical protein